MFMWDTWVTACHEGPLKADDIDHAERQRVWQGIADAPRTKTTEPLRAPTNPALAALFAQLPLPPQAASAPAR